MPKRLESGVVQMPNDWPGLFIRGDHCWAFSMALSDLRKIIPEEASAVSLNMLDGLIKDLQSVDTRNRVEPQLIDWAKPTKPTLRKKKNV